MSEVRLPIPGVDGKVLVFDSDDISAWSAPRDIHPRPSDDGKSLHHDLGAAHLNLTFRIGKQPLWEDDVSAGEGGGGFRADLDDR